MTVTTDDLRLWIANRYDKYDLSKEPVHGTYGLIWFLTHRNANVTPQSFAIKTLDPARLTDLHSTEDLDIIKREFQRWLELPTTYNVLPALGFEFATLRSFNDDALVKIPVMRMPRMDESLQHWIDKPGPVFEDRLIAIAQAFNGLLFLYSHGFEGHGDLKPSNILYSDLRPTFELKQDGWPGKDHPWLVRIADLGWADAWVDLGFTRKAMRQYLAPERLDDVVIPGFSDIFSMGIIAAEILQGRHPANLKKVLASEGKWRRCVEAGAWEFGGISSSRLKDLIRQCLSPLPEDRPTPERCLSEICNELRETFELDIEQTLTLWRKSDSPIEDHERVASAAIISAELGPTQALRSRQRVEQRLAEVDVQDFASSETWVTLAEAYIELRKAENHEPLDEGISIRDAAETYLSSILGRIDHVDDKNIPRRLDLISELQPYERFAELVGRMAKIAGVTYETVIADAKRLTSVAVSALAFSEASLMRSGIGDVCQVERLLAEAIRHAPDQAPPYYFRALWRDERVILTSALSSTDSHSVSDMAKASIADLETACRLSPDWAEPRRLLQRFRTDVQLKRCKR